MKDRDERYMREALSLARVAAGRGEIPVGCVVVLDDAVIGRGHNMREALQDPTSHAEIQALREAAGRAASWRLENAELFVTLEPCPMCAGALLQARVRRLVYGAADPKAGAAGSVVNLFEPGLFNHVVSVEAGILGEECGRLLKDFFGELR